MSWEMKLIIRSTINCNTKKYTCVYIISNWKIYINTPHLAFSKPWGNRNDFWLLLLITINWKKWLWRVEVPFPIFVLKSYLWTVTNNSHNFGVPKGWSLYSGLTVYLKISSFCRNKLMVTGRLITIADCWFQINQCFTIYLLITISG